MSRREPKRLDVMPSVGRVLVAHPTNEQQAVEQARDQLCDYVLSPWLLPGAHVYVFNLDQVNAGFARLADGWTP